MTYHGIRYIQLKLNPSIFIPYRQCLVSILYWIALDACTHTYTIILHMNGNTPTHKHTQYMYNALSTRQSIAVRMWMNENMVEIIETTYRIQRQKFDSWTEVRENRRREKIQQLFPSPYCWRTCQTKIIFFFIKFK